MNDKLASRLSYNLNNNIVNQVCNWILYYCSNCIANGLPINYPFLYRN